MVHFMNTLALSHGFDQHAFQEWADREGHKHGAFLDTVTMQTAVTTWEVDKLIDAARAVGFTRLTFEKTKPVKEVEDFAEAQFATI